MRCLGSAQRSPGGVGKVSSRWVRTALGLLRRALQPAGRACWGQGQRMVLSPLWEALPYWAQPMPTSLITKPRLSNSHEPPSQNPSCNFCWHLLPPGAPPVASPPPSARRSKCFHCLVVHGICREPCGTHWHSRHRRRSLELLASHWHPSHSPSSHPLSPGHRSSGEH